MPIPDVLPKIHMTDDRVPLAEQFSILSRRYQAVLSDVWGVVHNGVAAFEEACDALMRFRSGGGTVVLVTNAPRPAAVVKVLLDKLKVPRAAYDAIITSGDVTQHQMALRPGPVFHLGPKRDLPNFANVAVRLVGIEEAEYVVCTGLFNDETETPDDYRPLLADMLRRNLLMICANPDLVVDRGNTLIYCAGAIADLYGQLGGEVLYAGKPHRPIYDEAVAKIGELRGAPVARQSILAIGDSVRTDLSGASAFGLDCLFITSGIHAEELGSRHDPDLAALDAIFASAGVRPAAVARRLVW